MNLQYIIFICFGTPTKRNSSTADLTQIYNVAKEISRSISKFKIIITKSTVPVTTGDEIEKIMTLHPLTGEIIRDESEMYVFPATHYAAGPETMERAIGEIEAELAKRVDEFERAGKLLEGEMWLQLPSHT